MSFGENPKAAPSPRTSGKAVASLILGLLSFCLFILAGLPAAIFGILALSEINRSGGRISGSGLATMGIVTGVFGSLMSCLIPVLVALLLPAVQAAREAARSTRATANLTQIGMALHTYHGAKGEFPLTAVGGNGTPGSGLSWRVHVLPYLGEEALYRQFRLDEPWDSATNRVLVARMPEVFRSPDLPRHDYRTCYLGVSGPGCMFDPTVKTRRMSDVADGLGTTIIVVEVDVEHAVEWTKPEDWSFDPNRPTSGLRMRMGRWNALMGDGHADRIEATLPFDWVRRQMLIADER